MLSTEQTDPSPYKLNKIRDLYVKCHLDFLLKRKVRVKITKRTKNRQQSKKHDSLLKSFCRIYLSFPQQREKTFLKPPSISLFLLGHLFKSSPSFVWLRSFSQIFDFLSVLYFCFACVDDYFSPIKMSISFGGICLRRRYCHPSSTIWGKS